MWDETSQKKCHQRHLIRPQYYLSARNMKAHCDAPQYHPQAR
jgi:hypothetical protein